MAKTSKVGKTFNRCVKSVRKTVRARKGSTKESAAIAICTTSVLHPRGRTIKRYRRGKLATQKKIRGGLFFMSKKTTPKPASSHAEKQYIIEALKSLVVNGSDVTFPGWVNPSANPPPKQQALLWASEKLTEDIEKEAMLKHLYEKGTFHNRFAFSTDEEAAEDNKEMIRKLLEKAEAMSAPPPPQHLAGPQSRMKAYAPPVQRGLLGKPAQSITSNVQPQGIRS